MYVRIVFIDVCLLPRFSDVQILAMTPSLRYQLQPHKVRQADIGQALVFFFLRSLCSTEIQIKLAVCDAAMAGLITMNGAKRALTHFHFCWLRGHLFSLLHEQPQM